MKHADLEINSISDLISHLSTVVENPPAPIWYRGQASKEWKLLPKLLREEGLESQEQYLVSRFKQNAFYVLEKNPASEFDWLFLMQHYGAPTRLLDWSESPLASLYFAVENVELHGVDGVLWGLLPCELNLKSHYSQDGFPNGIPSFEDTNLQNYRPSSIAAERTSRLYPMAAIATRNSHRMVAQQGGFTISHRYKECMSEISSGDFLWRYIIPSAKKPIILNELRSLGINRFQLFPELQNISGI